MFSFPTALMCMKGSAHMTHKQIKNERVGLLERLKLAISFFLFDCVVEKVAGQLKKQAQEREAAQKKESAEIEKSNAKFEAFEEAL